ncbi:MAG: hypothetical protein ACK6CP_06370 [Pseudanabaena sp.]|nr:hypothetical protein [Pseudanabaena sp. 42896M_M3]
MRSPLSLTKPDRLFPTSNSDRPSSSKTRSAKSPHQTAIAPHHPQNLIAHFHIKQRSLC